MQTSDHIWNILGQFWKLNQNNYIRLKKKGKQWLWLLISSLGFKVQWGEGWTSCPNGSLMNHCWLTSVPLLLVVLPTLSLWTHLTIKRFREPHHLPKPEVSDRHRVVVFPSCSSTSCWWLHQLHLPAHPICSFVYSLNHSFNTCWWLVRIPWRSSG